MCYIVITLAFNLQSTLIPTHQSIIIFICMQFVCFSLCWGFKAQSTAKVMSSRSLTH